MIYIQSTDFGFVWTFCRLSERACRSGRPTISRGPGLLLDEGRVRLHTCNVMHLASLAAIFLNAIVAHQGHYQGFEWCSAGTSVRVDIYGAH